MWSLQPVIFFRVVDQIGDSSLLIETLLIDCFLGHIWFDDMELGQMSSAGALLGKFILHVFIKMAEIDI